MDDATATGQALAIELRRMAYRLDHGLVPAAVGRPLAKANRLADGRLARHKALRALRELIPHTSLWNLAQALEGHLARFRPVGYRRVRSGYRAPTEVEWNLLVLLDNPGPTCARKLWRELRDLTAPGQTESDILPPS